MDTYEGYTVRDDIITDPGKFEAEPTATLYYWDLVLEGCSDEETYDGDTPVSAFLIAKEDGVKFPYLSEDVGKFYVVWESDTGFVNHDIVTRDEWDHFVAECEAAAADAEIDV